MYTVTIEIESKRIHIEIYMVSDSDYGDHEDEDDDEDDHEEDDADHDDDAAAMIWTGFWHSNGKENTFIHTTSHYPPLPGITCGECACPIQDFVT